ncbi:MAG TPA: hypothetical protein VJZ91_09335 [Blastocatellia bacterium]|nr:hypothetical protein [Blastocatellia bacterium]
MLNQREPEYVLTVVQHTYCGDCIWLKGKITDVYIASGIVRGDDSKRWRMQILSPPWERAERKRDFPSGFPDIDVPALKLEVDNQIVFATQQPGLINEVLVSLKPMLVGRESNAQIRSTLEEVVRNYKEAPNQTLCTVT